MKTEIEKVTAIIWGDWSYHNCNNYFKATHLMGITPFDYWWDILVNLTDDEYYFFVPSQSSINDATKQK